MGLFLLSFVMLVFAMVGIFGYMEDAKFGALAGASVWIMGAAGILFAFLGYASWKGGNKFLMVIFLFLAFFAAIYSGTIIFAAGAPIGVDLIYIIIAVFVIIFAIWAFIIKAGMMLTVLLITSALVFLFYALALPALQPGSTLDWPGIYLLLLGIFALISFALATYLALADCTDGKLPTF